LFRRILGCLKSQVQRFISPQKICNSEHSQDIGERMRLPQQPRSAKTMKNNLDRIIKSLPIPSPAPLPLPLAHLTIVRWFDAIAKGGHLVPTRCDVFRTKLLYLSYGGVHYRTANKQSENATELPLAFVFDPTVLGSVERYYPFDTGAVAKKSLGKWTTRLRPQFKRSLKVEGGDHTVPSKMVHYIYGDNRRYLEGEVDAGCPKRPDPLPFLCQFLSTDLSSRGIDHRQRMIEAQTSKPLSLSKGLIWMAYPEPRTQDYKPVLLKIYSQTKPSLPFFYPYGYHKNFNPSAIAERLHSEAIKYISHYLNF
jgi:hypothetical protein